MYNSGGECCGASNLEGENSAITTIAGAVTLSTTATTGTFNAIPSAGRTLGDGEETIVLQQSCAWFAGLHGIEPQHCIVCWSADMGVRQSANCNANNAVSAKTKNVTRRIIEQQSRTVERAGQETGERDRTHGVNRYFETVFGGCTCPRTPFPVCRLTEY